MTKMHPVLALTLALVDVPGWIFIGMFRDPPPAPEGFKLETRDDGFLGYVTHYRHVELDQPSIKKNRKRNPRGQYVE